MTLALSEGTRLGYQHDENYKAIFTSCARPMAVIRPESRIMQVKTTFSKKDLSCSFMVRSPPCGGRYRLGR